MIAVKNNIKMFVTAGKGFVEAVKNKTEEELDEEVKMETENIQVIAVFSSPCSNVENYYITLLPLV